MISTPAPPDPWKTAEAQSQWNTTTAQTQQALNMVNQVTPWGNVNYDQTGTQTIIGADGRPISVPQYTATTTLSPEQQGILDQTQQAQGNIAGLAADQSAAMRERLAQPFEFTNRDAELWAYDLASPRILEQQRQNEERLRSILANKGIREGSAAWNAEMQRLTQANSDQLNQLALAGRGQAYGEARDQYTLPINSLTALMSGTQIANPAQMGASTPQTGVAGVDYTGLVKDKYNAELQASQAAMGGLFGLLSAPFMMFSDRRLKENVERVGETDEGTPIYTYNYKGDPQIHMGVMAQDVEKENPDAVVTHPSGFKMVDYREVG